MPIDNVPLCTAADETVAPIIAHALFIARCEEFNSVVSSKILWSVGSPCKALAPIQGPIVALSVDDCVNCCAICRLLSL